MMSQPDPAQHISKTTIDATEWDPCPLAPPHTIIAGEPATRVHFLRVDRRAESPYFAGLWSAEPSTFEYVFTLNETAHILEGEVVITQKDGPTLVLGPGDVVTFPRGAVTRWEVKRALKKVFVESR
jgi:uncharacterized cupin superfamily protein